MAVPGAFRMGNAGSAVSLHGARATEGATLYCTMEPCPMCAGALKLAGITRLVLALRHARLRRTDLGRFSVEAFCAMTGHALAVSDGVLEAPDGRRFEGSVKPGADGAPKPDRGWTWDSRPAKRMKVHEPAPRTLPAPAK